MTRERLAEIIADAYWQNRFSSDPEVAWLAIADAILSAYALEREGMRELLRLNADALHALGRRHPDKCFCVACRARALLGEDG